MKQTASSPCAHSPALRHMTQKRRVFLFYFFLYYFLSFSFPFFFRVIQSHGGELAQGVTELRASYPLRGGQASFLVVHTTMDWLMCRKWAGLGKTEGKAGVRFARRDGTTPALPAPPRTPLPPQPCPLLTQLALEAKKNGWRGNQISKRRERAKAHVLSFPLGRNVGQDTTIFSECIPASCSP